MDKAQQLTGKRIREARAEAGLNQLEVADAINMSRSNYQKIESGKIGVSGAMLKKLSELLKTDVYYLLDINPYPKPESKSLGTVQEFNGSSLERMLRDQIQILEQRLADKDVIIKLLEDKIAFLEAK